MRALNYSGSLVISWLVKSSNVECFCGRMMCPPALPIRIIRLLKDNKKALS